MEGWTDSTLNPLGEKQAQRLADRLSGLDYAMVYTSDLQRTQQTAAPLLGERPLKMVSELREMHFGKWENLTFQDISQRFPDAARRWQNDPVEVAPPDGETITDVARRVSSLLLGLGSGTDKLVVGHQGSLRALLCLLIDLPLNHYWRLRLDHAGITIVDTYTEGAILSCLNDCCHLEGLE
jgi:broad specificity phosphatase PhoE